MAAQKLIIKQQKTAKWYFCWICFAASLLLLAYYSGRYLAIEEREQAIENAAWLQAKLDEYQLAYRNVNQQLVMQTQSSKVDNQSNQQLMDTIKNLQDEQRKLQEELKFYHNIMAPELSANGLTIASFNLIQLPSSDKLAFKLALTQAGKQEAFLKGSVDIKVEGLLEGKTVNYPFRELGTFQAKHFQFQFRYFQNIEGEIQIPVNFEPKKIIVSAKTRGLRKNQTANKQFDWSLN